MIEIAHRLDARRGSPVQRRRGSSPSTTAESQLANSSPNARWTAQMAAVLNTGTVQRAITVDTKQYTAKQAAEALFISKLIDIRELDEYEKILGPFDDGGDSFESLEELKEAADDVIQAQFETEEESHIADPAHLEHKFWRDEKASLAQTNLGLTHQRGRSIRHGMDYETLDKDAFTVKGQPNRALVIRMNRPPGSHSISQEVEKLSELEVRGIPGARLYASGFYPIGGVAHPAMLQEKYAMSSKSLVRQQEGEAHRVEGWEEALEHFDTVEKCQNGDTSLRKVRKKISEQYSIEDIQFLIDDDGNFVVNDIGKTGAGYWQANYEVIDELIEMLGERESELSGD